jgi:hypothetical protein
MYAGEMPQAAIAQPGAPRLGALILKVDLIVLESVAPLILRYSALDIDRVRRASRRYPRQAVLWI